MCIITHFVIQSTSMMPILQSRSRLMLREALRLDAAMSLLVIAELVAFVEFNHSTFKLADLRKLYVRRLYQLGSDWIGVYVHQKRFKEHILEKLGPDWSEYSEGRDVYVS